MAAVIADVVTQVADVIEPHISGTFKRRQRAEGVAQMLAMYGLLVGGDAKTSQPVQEQATNLLQCGMNWPTAEQIADELAAAGLLKEG